jgi:hypothetical protein
MNYTKSLVGALTALAAGACMFGQSSVSEPTTAGLLGYRYVGAGLFVEDIRDLPVDNGFGGVFGVNLPLNGSLDLGLEYGFERIDDSLFDAREHSIGATLRAYNPYEGVKLFTDATLGYAWTSVRARQAGRFSDHDGFWALGVGVEAPVSTHTALVGRVSYNDSFESGIDGIWSFTGAVNHRFTRTVYGIASLTFNEDDSIVYGVGVAIRY